MTDGDQSVSRDLPEVDGRSVGGVFFFFSVASAPREYSLFMLLADWRVARVLVVRADARASPFRIVFASCFSLMLGIQHRYRTPPPFPLPPASITMALANFFWKDGTPF